MKRVFSFNVGDGQLEVEDEAEALVVLRAAMRGNSNIEMKSWMEKE